MKVPLEMTFRGVEETDEIKDLIAKKVTKLEEICDYIIRCRVAVEVPHHHQRSGNPYRVVVEIKVPHRHDIIVRRESGQGDMHEPLPSVVRRAFEAARRELQELVDRQHGLIKSHLEEPPMAFVASLFPEDGYGFLETPDGREIYFHRNSVLNEDFQRLEVGARVRFVEEAGENGPQASTVQLLKRTQPSAPE